MYHDKMKQKFSSQARPELLEEIRVIAADEGRQFQAIPDEALTEWVETRRGERPRTEVIAHAKASIARNRELYRKLAE